jgi:hypothetical protein
MLFGAPEIFIFIIGGLTGVILLLLFLLLSKWIDEKEKKVFGDIVSKNKLIKELKDMQRKATNLKMKIIRESGTSEKSYEIAFIEGQVELLDYLIKELPTNKRI